MEMLLFEGK